MKHYRALFCVLSVFLILAVMVLPSFADPPQFTDRSENWESFVFNSLEVINDNSTSGALSYPDIEKFITWKTYKAYYGSVSYTNSNDNVYVGQKWSTRPVNNHIDSVSVTSDWDPFAYNVHLHWSSPTTNGSYVAKDFDLYGTLEYKVVSIGTNRYTISIRIVNQIPAGNMNCLQFSADWSIVGGVPTLSNRVFETVNSSGNHYTLCVPSIDDYFVQVDFASSMSSDIYFLYFYGIVMSFNQNEVCRFTLPYESWLGALYNLNVAVNVGYDDYGDEQYEAGYQAGVSTADVGTFENIINTAVTSPVETLRTMLNWEFLGINLFGLIGSLLAVAIIVIILKKVL